MAKVRNYTLSGLRFVARVSAFPQGLLFLQKTRPQICLTCPFLEKDQKGCFGSFLGPEAPLQPFRG